MQSKTTKFFICGFSGAGKSTLLARIAEKRPEYSCVDLDDFILSEVQEQKLGDYINRVGLAEFREHEIRGIEELVDRENLVLTLGGGSLNEGSLELLKNFKGFWLDTSFDVCWERIRNDGNRPLVRQGKESLAELYRQRIKYYKNFQKVNSIKQVLEII